MVESSNLAPGLLLAMPQLADPNFTRAVILMIEHGEHGSFGLVINHPSQIKATELLDSLEMTWHGEASAVVWAGGPVQPSTGWVLHEPIGIAQAGVGGTIAITSSISLSTSPERLRAIASQPPRNIRLLLAMPQLADPNFSRAVVLMIEHGEAGSFGLVINHPSPIRAAELLDSLEMI